MTFDPNISLFPKFEGQGHRSESELRLKSESEVAKTICGITATWMKSRAELKTKKWRLNKINVATVGGATSSEGLTVVKCVFV